MERSESDSGRPGGAARQHAKPIEDAIRIFISYSKDDQKAVEQIAAILESGRRQVIYDKHLAYGSGFHSQIKHLI